MMNNPFTSKITEFLELQGIPYRLLMHKTEATSIEDAAQQRGIRPAQMVKTMVLRDMGGLYALACVPGDQAVDPKKVRALLDCRRMTCVDLSQVESITGYKAGTVAPLLLKRHMPIFFDQQLLAEDEITISSGSRMAGVALSCQDLIQLCQPQITNICR